MSDFNELINSEKPTLVDFFATWCGPCRMMTPIINEMEKEMVGDANILKLDVDQNKEIAIKYGIRGVPTFIIFKNGEPVWRQSGAMSKNVLVEKLNQYSQ
jgi:thioredoxin 1